MTTTNTPDGPFRTGRSWGYTVVYDPDFDPDTATKTGVLWAMALTHQMADEIVAALNQAYHSRCPDCRLGMIDVTAFDKPPHSDHIPGPEYKPTADPVTSHAENTSHGPVG